MDFIKKNYGLLLFLIVTFCVIVFQVFSLLGAQSERTKNKEMRQKHLEELQKVRRARTRLDALNQKKAESVAQSAKRKYSNFLEKLWEKRLLPGVDFTVDPDEEALEPAPEAELDENGNPLKPKKDPYKDLPYRRKFDEWMKGSLADAREILTNELLLINKKYFKSSGEQDAKQTGGNRAAQLALEQQRETEERIAAQKEGKSTYDVEKEKRTKIIKGAGVPEYFMFNEYVHNRENGLRSLKEKRNVFRQLLLLNTIASYLQQAEITELISLQFPCGLEFVEGDQTTVTPIKISMSGKPECIESFMNLINANEQYVFVLRDVVDFAATVQLNDDPEVLFNQNPDGTGATLLKNYLGGGARSVSVQSPTSYRQRSNSSFPARRDGQQSENEKEATEEQKTRKAYRIFAKQAEQTTGGRDENQAAGLQRKSAAAEAGTIVTVTLNFEYVEYKRAN